MFQILQLLISRVAGTMSATIQRSVASYFAATRPQAVTVATSKRFKPVIDRFSESVGRGPGMVSPFSAMLNGTASRLLGRGATGLIGAVGRRGASAGGSGPGMWGTSPNGSGNGGAGAGSRGSTAPRSQPHDQRRRGFSDRVSSWWRGITKAVNSPARAARIQERLQQRYRASRAAVRASRPTRNISESARSDHRALLANSAGIRRRLAAVGALNAKATGSAAAASGKVASALLALGGKMAGFVGMLTIPAAILGAIVKLPSWVAARGDARIADFRRRGDYGGQTAAMGMRYDVVTQNLAALSARDTVESRNQLVNQQNRLRKALRPWGDWFNRIGNDIQSTFAGGIANMLGGWTEATEWVGIVGREAVGAAQGQGFNPKRVREAKDAAEKAREEKQRQENNTFDQPLSRTLDAWAKSIDNKEEARVNRRPKPPLPPLR